MTTTDMRDPADYGRSNTQRRARGQAHPHAVYSNAQVALAKRLLEDAPRVTVLARGTLRDISKRTGIARSALLHIHYGTSWSHIEPATTEGGGRNSLTLGRKSSEGRAV